MRVRGVPQSRCRRQSRDKRQGLWGRECVCVEFPRAVVAVSHVIKDKGSGVENDRVPRSQLFKKPRHLEFISMRTAYRVAS